MPNAVLLLLVPVLVVIVFLVAIVIHEAGHAVGASLVRFRVYQIALGQLPLRRTIRIGRLWVGIGGWGPALAMVRYAPTGRRAVRLRMAVTTAAGPAANLLAAAALWPFVHGSPMITMICYGNLATGLVNLLPVKAPTVWDGTKLLRLARHQTNVTQSAFRGRLQAAQYFLTHGDPALAAGIVSDGEFPAGVDPDTAALAGAVETALAQAGAGSLVLELVLDAWREQSPAVATAVS